MDVEFTHHSRSCSYSFPMGVPHVLVYDVYIPWIGEILHQLVYGLSPLNPIIYAAS